MSVWAEVLGLVAGFVGLSMAAPQAWRVHKQGSFGVSVGTWMLMFTSCCSWLGYGLRTSSPSQVVTNVIAASLGAWLLSTLLAGRWWRWWFIVGVPPVAVAVLVTVDAVVMNVVLFSFLVAFAPQLVRSFSAWRSRTPIVAVSMWSWSLSAISSLLWLGYAWAGDRPLVVATCTCALAAAAAILLFTRLANAAAQATPDDGPPPDVEGVEVASSRDT